MSSEAEAAREHDPVLPRTEGERRLPDGKIPSSEELNRTESEDLETLRMMEEAGIDSSMPIDPSSLKALQELLTPKSSHGKSLAKVEDSKQPAMPNLTGETKEETKEQNSLKTPVSAHVPSEVLRPLALGRVTSDLTMGLRSESMVDEDTDASTAGSTQRGSNMDKRILDQLQMQTALLLDLQRRVDELTQIVITQQGQLQQQGVVPPTLRGFPPPRPLFADTNPPPRAVPPEPQQQARNAPQPPAAAPQQPPQMFFFAIFTAIPNYIRSTRVAEICRVYWALHRRDMRGRINLNLIIKIFFVGLILFAKFSASNKRKKGDRTIKNTVQLCVAVFLIVGGFMLQSGYALFLTNFFIKERYVQRIWNGEQIDVAEQQPPRRAERRQQRQVQGDDEEEEEVNEGPGLLRGGIPQAPAQAGMIGKFVMDIVYLFGSFVLSILPMWKAEAQQQGGRRGDANQRAAAQQNEGEDQGGNDGGVEG